MMTKPHNGIPRIVDAGLALAGLLALSPLLALSALAVALSSPGPVLFRQERIGRHGRKFILSKFRTMKAAQSGPQITVHNDNRITWFGHFLRKTKLDEIPELFNVLKGDMSLVGPRPEVDDYVDLDNDLWRRVLEARPGITDPVTLCFRNEEEVLARVEGDKQEFYLKFLQPIKLRGYIEYLEMRSVWSDLKTILFTLLAVVLPRSSLLDLQQVKAETERISFQEVKQVGERNRMLSLVKSRNFWVMICLDTMLVLCAYYSAYFIRFDGSIPSRDFYLFKTSVVWVVLIKLAFLFGFKLYRGMWRYTSVHDLLSLMKALTTSFATLACSIFTLFRDEAFSRGVFIIDFLLSLILLGGLRLAIRLVIEHLRGKSPNGNSVVEKISPKRLVIVGAGSAGEKLVREIKENRRLSYDIVGFVDDNIAKLKLTIHGIPVLGSLHDLKTIVKDFMVDELIIAVPSASAADIRRMVSFCKGTSVPFKTVPGIGELIEGKVSVNAIREVRYEDLLGRSPAEIEISEVGRYLTGKRVMVTGAAGSIGSELCRQIAQFKPSLMVLVDRNESGLYEIEMEFKVNFPQLEVLPVLSAIQNKTLMQKFFDQHQAQAVFHAAAYKHVPMMELHPWEAVFNNVLGTETLLDLCIRYSVEKCVIVSTDKAVRPSNVMGASKRLTELLAQAFAEENGCRFMAVRFGNVIGSVGSVVPLFRKQIAQGGPVTVTHKDITRYFMTIPEACRLILQAGAIGQGGEIFVLKMGTPIRIDSLARDMITLSGFKPDEDIRIEYVGLRPGEKLHEELVTDGEDILPTRHEKIMVLSSNKHVNMGKLRKDIAELAHLAVNCNIAGIKDQLSRMIADYTPSAEKAPNIIDIPAFADGKVILPDTSRVDTHKGNVRLLVIDDEKSVTDSLTAYLNAAGYTSSAAYSAGEGLIALDHEQYDLIIADLKLSDMKGTQLLEAIRKQDKKVGVIIMTGYATIGSGAEAMQKGAQNFISKPFSFAELETVIGRTLSRKEGVL